MRLAARKGRINSDYVPARVGEDSVDVPFNKVGYRYYVVEEDKNVYDKNYTEDSKNRIIPAHLYRIAVSDRVSVSPNDRAYQLRMNADHLTITGDEGYCMARASHSVAAGKWYFEVQFTKDIGESAVRIGWAQQYADNQGFVGYSKFSYGWRSRKGTKFHDASGRTYSRPGFKEGDVLGCLISLPFDPLNPGPDSSKYLPNSGKDFNLIKCKKNTFFFEEQEDPASVLKTLEPLKGSYIEFFRNGASCGKAYTDIYGGFYFPAISIFRQATVTMNFGPTFTHPPPEEVKAMSERPEELAVEQTLADMLFTVDKNLYLQK